MNTKVEFDFKTTFPPLDHPEHHFNKYPNHPWLKSKEEIEGWISNKLIAIKILVNGEILNIKDCYVIHDDMTVSLNLDTEVLSGVPLMKVQIREVNGCFTIRNGAGLESLIGTPYKCFELYSGNQELSSFEGLGNDIRLVDLSNNKLKSFRGMPNSLRNDLNLHVMGNMIKSWDGFTKSKVLFGNFFSINKERNKQFILNIPKEVEEIYLSMINDDDFVKTFVSFDENRKRLKINIEKVRHLQKLEQVKGEIKVIENSIKEVDDIKKRKI